MRTPLLASLSFCVLGAWSSAALANAQGVGLGVGAGVAYSGTKLDVQGIREAVGARYAWGFFVDIPLLQTFYITPSTTVYELDVDGDGNSDPLTDVDLNFKFIVPLGDLRLGAGVLTGLTVGLDRSHYVGHWGLLGYGSFKLVANIDIFTQVQYEKLLRDSGQIDDIHVVAGGMFYF